MRRKIGTELPIPPQVIDHELIRNLVISGGVILGLICMLVPQPRIAMLVALAIILSLVELVGIMYFWDVTINGVSTIYIMICVGLAVDYSAHIAHCFKESGPKPVSCPPPGSNE